MIYVYYCIFIFFFTDPATTEIYTLSLHDALPISLEMARGRRRHGPGLDDDRRRRGLRRQEPAPHHRDRKSTRLNSSHSQISYAVFCLKKKKKNKNKKKKNTKQHSKHKCTSEKKQQ